MKSVIICEGITDFTLLQYYMQKVNGWSDYRKTPGSIGEKRRDLQKGDNVLTIIASGGCTKIPDVFGSIIRLNNNFSSEDERYQKIVILTDNDDELSEENLIKKFKINLRIKKH